MPETATPNPVPPPGWPRLEGWKAIVRRVRVPLGFVTAVLFILFARPTWASLATSLVLVALGVWLRAYAAGYVKKNTELTHTGPYAHTRNPLYLGSLLIVCGFALAAHCLWLAVLLIGLFLFIYIPVILSEEVFLRSVFPTFDAYAASVPRLLPRITAARFPDTDPVAGRFDRARYLHHREYNALMGAGAVYALLVVRMLLLRHGV
jgi:protein-S-isoprenylcysteine O-methyltransferase Ste14